jgi:solute carrier family 50 protein (sugar transporter)
MIVGETTAFVSSAFASAAAPSFVRLCSSLAAPASVLVSAAPLPTIRQIQAKRDVGCLPLLPYSCMAANCVLWTAYGVLQNTPSIWLPNGAGLVLALYYMDSFLTHAYPDKKSTPRPLKMQIGGVGAVIGSSALAVGCQSVLAAPAPAIAEMVGGAAVLFCMALFASPLAALKHVIETRSAESIPLPFTIASLLCCFLWSVTGILELHDLNVIIPNVVGFMFGLAQIALKLRFSGAPRSVDFLQSTEVTIDRATIARQYSSSALPFLQ